MTSQAWDDKPCMKFPHFRVCVLHFVNPRNLLFFQCIQGCSVVQFSKIISCSPNFQETCCEVRMPVFLFIIRNVYEAMDHNTGVSWAVPFPLCRKWLWEDTLYWVGLLVRWTWGGVCGEGRGGRKLVYLEGYGHIADTVLITSGLCTTQLRTVTLLGRTGSCTMHTTGWPCLFLWALLSSLCWASCFCYCILLRWGTVCLARTTLWTWGCSSGLLGICLITGISISILNHHL